MNETCVSCEAGLASEVVATRSVAIGGRELEVAGDRFMQCDTCGEEYFTDEQARFHLRLVNDARRRKEALLTGEQVQRIRQALMLSQAQLEDALGVSRKTVVRWENSTSVQSKALDDVLRLIELDPDNLRLLVRIRHAALAPVLEQKLGSQDHILMGELAQAVYAGVERATESSDITFQTDLVDQITKSVVDAIVEHKRERVRSASESIGVAI